MKNAENERELVRPTFLQENETNDAISIIVIYYTEVRRVA